MAGHTEQAYETAVLAGLFVQLTHQRRSGRLAEVGAAAGQMPPPGTRVAVGDPRQQHPVGGVACDGVRRESLRAMQSVRPRDGMKRRHLGGLVGLQIDRGRR